MDDFTSRQNKDDRFAQKDRRRHQCIFKRKRNLLTKQQQS